MISIQKHFLFVHVPKTGGNSLQTILRDYSEDQIAMVGEHQDGIERFEIVNDKYPISKHSTLSHYKSVLEPDIYGSLFKFAVIRNPWDRMVSFYFSPHRGIVEWNRQEFLYMISRIPPVRYYICEDPFSQAGIPSPIDADLDRLIHFERLSDEFQEICDRLGIPCPPLPKRNQSQRDHYSVYYDDQLREMVGSRFREEIEFGGYEFESA